MKLETLRKIVVLFFCISLLSFFVPNNFLVFGDGESWLTGWTYRKSHTVVNATGSGTNYQVLINVDYGSGSDSGDTVYLDGNCESDFVDIRFTDNDGDTLLDAWNVSQTDGDSVSCWVEVADDLSTSNVTIYIYYGNSEASPYWDGLATFIRWDDFDLDYSVDDTVNASRGWATEGISGGSYVLIKSNPDGSGLVARIEENGDATNTMLQSHFGGEYENIAVHLSIRRGQDRTIYMYARDDNTTTVAHSGVDWTQDYFSYYDGSWTPFSPTLAIGVNTWYEIEYHIDRNTDHYAIEYGGSEYIGDFYQYVDGIDAFFMHNLRTQVGTLYVDNFFVRKYQEVEPTHGPWGSEESQTGDSYPDYYNVGDNGITQVGMTVTVYCNWTDDLNLDTCYLETNTTGTPVNSSISVSGTSSWANGTITLNYTAGLVVYYRWFCSDNASQWNTTSLYNITTTSLYLTFQINNSTRGRFYVDSVYTPGGTSYPFDYSETVFLLGATYSDSYVWTSFNWSGGSSEANFYNFSAISNDTITCYLNEAGEGGTPETETVYIGGTLAVVLIVAVISGSAGFVVSRVLKGSGDDF